MNACRSCILYAFLLDHDKFGEREGSRMADDGSILEAGAALQLGAVGRTVTSLLLERRLPLRAMVRREDDRAAALRAAGAEEVAEVLLEPAEVDWASEAVDGSRSASPFCLGSWRRA
jgi:hypothetical protein